MGDKLMERLNIYFNIEKRGKYSILVDNRGVICGIFGNERKAREAISTIRNKMLKDFNKKVSQGLKDTIYKYSILVSNN